MHRTLLFSTALCLVALTVFTSAAFGQTSKGQVTVGAHEYDMKADGIYYIRVQAKEFHPRVAMTPGFLPFIPQDLTVKNRFIGFYMPKKDKKNTIQIVPELYNLKSDISESNDLSGTEKARVQSMASAWEAWNKKNIPPLWTPPRVRQSKKKKS